MMNLLLWFIVCVAALAISRKSIKKLVECAEPLAKDRMRTPTKQKHSNRLNSLSTPSTAKKRSKSSAAASIPKEERVQEWLATMLEEQQQQQQQQQQDKTNSNESFNLTLAAAVSAAAAATVATVAAARTDDCEASSEASEMESLPHQLLGSDSSEGFNDGSIATCMQASTTSYGNSTEIIVVGKKTTMHGSSNQSLNVQMKINKRTTSKARSRSDRPWSVSCISQLMTTSSGVGRTQSNEEEEEEAAIGLDVLQAALATHSISESALDSLTPHRKPRIGAAISMAATSTVTRKSDSKSSLRRRRTRRKRFSISKRSESGSDELHDQATALIVEQTGNVSSHVVAAPVAALKPPTAVDDNDAQPQLMKPNFRVGSVTQKYLSNEFRLESSLRHLSGYINNEEDDLFGGATTGTEEHNSGFSGTWDSYQEKYNSENYSENRDSDAARRLFEACDDYRNFLDSDCCSSLSAANNLESLSPARMDSLSHSEQQQQQQQQQQLQQQLHLLPEALTSTVDHARRRRGLEMEYERRRKTLEERQKALLETDDSEAQNVARHNHEQHQQQQQKVIPATQEQTQKPDKICSPKTTKADKYCGASKSKSDKAYSPKSNGNLSASACVLAPKHASNSKTKLNGSARKSEMSQSAQSLPRRTSESDNSIRRRRSGGAGSNSNGICNDERRRSSRNLEKLTIKALKPLNVTSSSDDDDDDNDGLKEINGLLQQSRSQLEDINALRLRCNLLRIEDYDEIVNICRENTICLESVLRSLPSTVLSAPCAAQTKDLHVEWRDLLRWSENASEARRMQDEMIQLKHTLNRLGNKESLEQLDTVPAIQLCIEALEREKSQLSEHSTCMLRLNSAVHRWLTREEQRIQLALQEQQQAEQSQSQLQSQQQMASENQQLVEQSTTMATQGERVVYDVKTLLDAERAFHEHLKNEVAEMYRARNDADARISAQLDSLRNSQLMWRQLECGLSEFQQVLGEDRGTLMGLEGALEEGRATPVELAQNMKLVAKLLSEKVQMNAQQQLADANHIFHFTASSGSLSDSGISDGGTNSDGGLSERERRLGVLRRLAKQLESAIAPGSEAMRSIAARMAAAEAELKHLQSTCRELIVRTASTHRLLQATPPPSTPSIDCHRPQPTSGIEIVDASNKVHKFKFKRQRDASANAPHAAGTTSMAIAKVAPRIAATSGDPDDPEPAAGSSTANADENGNADKSRRRHWMKRFAKAALPVQFALFTVFCAACVMQPNCCDNINNFAMSFTPHLRYVRGPPPI